MCSEAIYVDDEISIYLDIPHQDKQKAGTTDTPDNLKPQDTGIYAIYACSHAKVLGFLNELQERSSEFN